MSQPQQPKKDYLARIYGVGKIIGKTLTTGPSIQHRMKKWGKVYTGFGSKSWSIQEEKARKALYGKRGKLQSPSEDLPILEEMIKQAAAPRQGFPGQKGITREQLEKEWYPKLLKAFGMKKAEEFRKALTLQADPRFSQFRPGVQVMVEKAKEGLLGTKNVRRKDITLAQIMLEGLMPSPPEKMDRKGFTQEKMAEVEAKVEKVLGKQAGAVYREALGAQKFSTDQTPQSSNPAEGNGSEAFVPKSRWKISGATNWGRRQNNDTKNDNK